MTLTTRARYALRAVLDIARAQKDGPVRSADIAHRQKLSAGYLERLLVSLVEHGIIESQRGPGGGYRLARPADRTSVRDVIMASGEPLAITPCVGKNCRGCGSEADCPAYVVWDGLYRTAQQYLAGLFISELSGYGFRAVDIKENGLRPVRSVPG